MDKYEIGIIGLLSGACVALWHQLIKQININRSDNKSITEVLTKVIEEMKSLLKKQN